MMKVIWIATTCVATLYCCNEHSEKLNLLISNDNPNSTCPTTRHTVVFIVLFAFSLFLFNNKTLFNTHCYFEKKLTMLKNSSAYAALWILLQLLVEINCQMKLLPRFDHTATLIDGKLYILGGLDEIGTGEAIEKDFFYLDVSVQFDTQNLLWQ